jgi:CheY-like chemotaxis protein
MNCPRCQSAITQSFDPDSIIVCPGCGARLMTRAAALRSQGRLKPADLTPAPPPPAAAPPSDPSAQTPRSPVNAFPLERPAAGETPTLAPTTAVVRSGSSPSTASSGSMEQLLKEMRLVRAAQDEILDLLRDGGGGRATPGPPTETRTSSVLQPVRSRRRKTVLLVDDDPETCAAARTELEAADVPVRVATQGNDALKLIAEDKPDVIALELALEGDMAGKDMINLVKATMEWVDIPIILWTSEPVTTQKEARLVHGADEVVQKSSGPAALVTRVITVFRKA